MEYIKRDLERKFLHMSSAFKAVMVVGARQVGKTFIIDHFGENNYSSYLNINFIFNPECRDIFAGNLEEDEIFKAISIQFPRFRLIPGDTLVFRHQVGEHRIRQQGAPAGTHAAEMVLRHLVDQVVDHVDLRLDHGRGLLVPVGESLFRVVQDIINQLLQDGNLLPAGFREAGKVFGQAGRDC